MHLHMILCGIFHLSAVIQSAVKQDSGVISVSVGDNVTLHCFYHSQVAMHFSWYKQILGDSATYFCGSSHSNMVEFGKGVFLSVKGATPKGIVQSPVSETIQPGGSMTFNCTVHTETCDGKHSVYWFRHGSRQGILHRHISTPQSSSQSCVYHLQKMNVSTSDAGTYYCAVAYCGMIMFGNGSELVVRGDVGAQMAQMKILVWLSIIRTVILLFFMTICLLVYTSRSRQRP
uniref:uncharacterized protein LOC124054997 isoform X2 n=1 Tax=Scatophagus argus TaxID=75038 RepID=UPI001ED83E67|nr:uncharacterized protein LOC124054997 isoform X2 [Scatophagus argus]